MQAEILIKSGIYLCIWLFDRQDIPLAMAKRERKKTLSLPHAQKETAMMTKIPAAIHLRLIDGKFVDNHPLPLPPINLAPAAARTVGRRSVDRLAHRIAQAIDDAGYRAVAEPRDVDGIKSHGRRADDRRLAIILAAI